MANEPLAKKELPPSGGLSPESIREISPEEREILDLEAQLARKRADLGARKTQETAPQQEAILDAIIEGQPPVTSVSDSITPPPTDDGLSGEEKFRLNQLKQMDKESQLKFLINISFQKGLDEGVRLAKSLNNPYILDEFHDQLADQFYSRLIETKNLKEL